MGGNGRQRSKLHNVGGGGGKDQNYIMWEKGRQRSKLHNMGGGGSKDQNYIMWGEGGGIDKIKKIKQYTVHST